jgi:hypothetical protein
MGKQDVKVQAIGVAGGDQDSLLVLKAAGSQGGDALGAEGEAWTLVPNL